MHIVEIRLLNWLRYRGDHQVRLTPTVYGVVACHVDDDGRSNWLGKTSLLEAIRFALFGKRPTSCSTEDSWITRGEGVGGVGLLLSDGTVIERRRERGKPTKFGVQLCESKLVGDDAQTVLRERLGLSHDDFVATCFFPQKEISRFVTAQAAERMRIIAGWLQLEPLQRAEKATRQLLNTCLDNERSVAADLKSAMESVRQSCAKYFEFEPDEVLDRDEVLTELQSIVTNARKVADVHQATATRLNEAFEQQLVAQRVAVDATRYDSIMAQVATIEADPERLVAIKANLDGHNRFVEETRAKLADAQTRARTAERLACGRFDGVCPVDGHDCPDASQMNVARDANGVRAIDARREANLANAAYTKAIAERDVVANAHNELVSKLAQRTTLMHQAEQYRAAKSDRALVVDDSLKARKDEAWSLYQSAESDAREVARTFGFVQGLFNRIANANVTLAAIRREIIVYQQAVVILGKTGAQRRIAESALADIQAMSNESLIEAGIDLRVAITWSHPGQGLADECVGCGQAFATKGVSTCSRCGAVRGPKIIESIEVELSNVSGAAQDLAGVVIQLAAGAWLRSKRGAAWSCACIDEPFGALDQTNKVALATHLATLLRGRYGFEQAIVVAHDRGIMDALPGRVHITADDSGSHVAVV